MKKRLVYICDWLPPDFGAVGQYAVLVRASMGERGMGGHTGRLDERAIEPTGRGSRSARARSRSSESIAAAIRNRKFVARLVWTVVSNVMLLGAAFRAMRRADAVLFTGSPPLMLHFIAPLNLLLRKRLIYRITDFHPECLIAERGRSGLILAADFCVSPTSGDVVLMRSKCLGLDQARRLTEDRHCRDTYSAQARPVPCRHSHRGLPLYRCRMNCAAGLGLSFIREIGALLTTRTPS